MPRRCARSSSTPRRTRTRSTIAQANGEHDEAAEAVNDLLLPIVKGYCSERAWVLLGTESLQTFGGSGFLQDYPIEQYVRDSKIDTLYEGTTAIQGLDFFFRKIVRNKGQALGAVAAEIGEFLESEAGNGRLKVERKLLAKGLEDAQALVGLMIKHLMSEQPAGRGGRRRQHLQGRAEHHPAADDPRRRRLLLPAAPSGRRRSGRTGRRGVRPRTRRSTRARSPPPSSSPATCCRRSPPSARSPRRPT